MKKQVSKSKNWIQYYDDRDILNEITDESVDFVLDERLRDDILSGKRKRNLKNVTIKVDPLQIKAIKKLSTMKGNIEDERKEIGRFFCCDSHTL